jgi:stage V sporulation protein S
MDAHLSTHHYEDLVTEDLGHSALIKVSARSRSTAVAGAIAGVIREHRHAEVQAIGAGAVYQTVKAIAIARNYLTEEYTITSIPIFTEVMINEQERTAIRFIIEGQAV